MVIFFALLLNGPLLYCYEDNLTGTPARCYRFSLECRLYTDISYTCETNVIPSFFMLFFGLLMINNIRQIRKRINIQQNSLNKSNGSIILVNINVQQQQQKKKTDRSLLKMVFVQVIFLILCTGPYTIYKVYATVPPAGSYKSDLQNAIERLLFNFCTNLTYLATAMPFYLYTLFGGKAFRKELFNGMYASLPKKRSSKEDIAEKWTEKVITENQDRRNEDHRTKHRRNFCYDFFHQFFILRYCI